MTVDTDVKIVESEKCGLDMSSYEDLHSSPSVADVGGNDNGNGDVRDDYVFVTGNDVASSDDHAENRENLAKLGENRENVAENRENVAELVENRENPDNLSENRDNVAENRENVAKLVENRENVDIGENRENVAKLVENHENPDNLGKNHENVAENRENVASLVENRDNADDLSKDHEDGEINVSSGGEDHENVPKLDENHEDGKVVADKLAEKRENEEVIVANLSVERDDNDYVVSDSLENGVKVAEEELTDENGVNVREESVVVENGEMKLEKEAVVVENGQVDVSDRVSEPLVDEVKEGSVPETVTNEVKEDESADDIGSRSLDVDDNNKYSVSDVQELAEVETENTTSASADPDALEDSEVKEDSVSEPVIDEVKESNNPKPVVDGASVNSIGSRTFDAQESAEIVVEDSVAVTSVPDAPEPSELKEGSVMDRVGDDVNKISDAKSVVEEVKEDETVSESGDNNDKISASDAQASTEIEAEDTTTVTNVPDDSELLETKEGSVPDPVIDEVKESNSNNPEPVIDEIKEDESGFVTGDDVNVSVDSNGSRSLDVDDNSKNSVHDAQESAEVEDSTYINGVLDAPQPSEVEAQIDNAEPDIEFPFGGGIKIQGSEPERLEEDQVGAQKVTENYSDVHGVNVPDTECLVTESKETNVSDESIENGLGKAHSLPRTDEENEKQNLIETLAKTDNQGDLDLVTAEKSCELGLDKKDELIDQINSESADIPEETIPNQSEEIQNEGDVEFAALEINDPLLIGVAQSSDSKAKSIAEVEENDEALTSNTEMETTDEPTLDDKLEMVDRDGQSEAMAETGGVDVVDKEISPEDCSSEKNSTLEEDTTNLSEDSKLPYEDNRGSDADQNDTTSKPYTVDSGTNVSINSINIFDGTSRPKISFGSFGDDINFPSDSLNTATALSTVNGEAPLNCTEDGDHSDELNNDVTCAEVAHPEQVNEVSATSDGQNVNPDLVRRPFYWLIKVPRLDDGKYKDQLRQIEVELDEKTKTRDAFQAQFSKKQADCRELRITCEAANSEVKSARELMWAKSREIDSAHSVMNLARHGITVEDLDKKINDLEHRLQHETLSSMKEEKELVREIKQLNIERQKIAGNRQRQQEIQKARNQKDQAEQQLKGLKKEMDALRDNVSKADECFKAAKKKYDDESVLLNELRHQLKSADDIRQEAYSRLRTLKKQLNEKNAPFYKAKDDLRLAYNYATAGKNDALERHCINQVEKVMEIWNKNDEFRKEYIKCNTRRTLWKFGTLDGTCLGIDEVPLPLGDVSNNRVNISAKVTSVTPILTVKRDLPVKPKITEDKSLKKVEQKKAPSAKKNEVISTITKDIEKNTEEPKLTKEEEELARKAEQSKREEEELAKKTEQLRQEEEAVRLREQLRLEEKAKAAEALERKRKIAMKAQARAEFKARKEAEEKEKEREKRAMKKRKKKGIINSEITENESAQPSEPSSESIKEDDEKPVTITKRSQKASSLHMKQIKTTKPIPPALRNKGKRGLLRYWPYACILLLAVALFYLGSFETIETMKQHISALLHW